MTTWKDVACPACASQPGEVCYDLNHPMVVGGKPGYPCLITPHAERIEAAYFVESLAQPAQDRAQITDAEILATGDV